MGTLKHNVAKIGVAGLAMAGLLSSMGAQAEPGLTVECDNESCTSATMGGRWDQNFGNNENNCLYLLGTNPVRRNEAPIGPGQIESTQDENSVSCLGGLDSPNLVDMGSVQVRVFSGAGDTETVAYSWTYPDGDSLVSASQFIPDACTTINGFNDFDSTDPVNVRNGGFDNGDTDDGGPRPVVKPLSLEFSLGPDVRGNAVLSYYFMNGTVECRDQSWKLYVNDSGTPVKEGVISNFADGKYLIFNLNGLGLDGGDKFRLDLNVGPVSEGCEEDPLNQTVSGLFISGTSVCGYCGDGFFDPATEDCDGSDPTDPNAAMCSESCEIIDPLGCRFTGGLNDIFITQDEKKNRYSAGGQVGANTGQQPQPKGEWTHRQRRGPAGRFTFHGGTASAPLGSEIDEIRCSDPGGCTPSGDPPSPVKQLDFDGIGTFKNIGRKNGSRIPDFVKAGANATAEGHGNENFDGTLHWFEVNIDDLGEPGNTNPKKNPGDGTHACPTEGFGEKGVDIPGDCSCSDFYRITIYDGVNAADVERNDDGSIDKANMKTSESDVIYQVWGYIDGGNLQLHHPTGFDLK